MGSFVPKIQTSEWSWVARRRQKDTKCGRNSNRLAPQRHRQATPSSSAKRQAPARRKSPFQQLTAWRHLETAERYMQSSALFGGLRLVVRGFRQAAVFVDVSSLPLFFCFREGKRIFGILEARRKHLESLEEC